MTRNELLEQVKRRYIKARLPRIEPEFLLFEEEMINEKDLMRLIEAPLSSIRFNTHNSALLYATGITDQYDRTKHVETIGGSPPDKQRT